MFTAHASINLPVTPQWVWMHASSPDFLKFVPPVSDVKSLDSDHLAIQIRELNQDGYCVVKPTLREPPHRIAWHSVSGALHLRAEIVIERTDAGSQLSVELYALPKDANLYATARLEQAFDGLQGALERALKQFALRFATGASGNPADPRPSNLALSHPGGL